MIMEFFQTPKAQVQLDMVCVQDFGDEYHKDLYDPDDKLMAQVRMVRRRYRTTIEYQYAVNIINKYIALMMVKYGGEDKFIALLRAELIEEYLPPIPKMKGGDRNKEMIKKGFLVSSASFKKLDVERLDELRERYTEVKQDDIEPITFTERDDKRVKQVNKLIDEKGVDKIVTSYARTMNLDLFEEFFANRSKKQAKQQEEFITDITVRDILDPNYKENVVDVDDDGDEFIPFQGGFIHRDEVDTVTNMRKMAALGWDQVKLARRVKGSKNILRLTQHESKKEKKRRKKREKAGDRFLLELTGQADTHSSFGAFEEAMLDFTSQSRFK